MERSGSGGVQIDTVAHCEDRVSGDFTYTVNGVDVATFWSVRRAQWQKGQQATRASIDTMRTLIPFTWTEARPDTGGELYL